MMICGLRRMLDTTKNRFIHYPYVFNIKFKKCLRKLHTNASKSRETELVKELKAKIKFSGPITVAEYMKEVLSHPLVGYYMKKDVFGLEGDFITSPEISQIFGELIGIWFYERWLYNGSPRDIQFVELGPGRGTLISDILRVFARLGRISEHLSLHLVEISPAMREMQKKILCISDQKQDVPMNSNTTKDGIPVTWHHDISDVPKGCSFYLAHEFFDALPIHEFQRTRHGWREVMVDVDEDGPHHLKFCLAPSNTPASVLLPKGKDLKADKIEIRPQAQVIVEEMAQNIKKHGGSSLIVDYGDVDSERNTLRAFQNHQLVHPLFEPGHSDLTSNVDFSALKEIFSQYKVSTFGPVRQQDFLKAMGIDVRKQVLLKKASVEQVTNIETAYRMLTDDNEMGNCFKFFAGTGGSEKPPGF
ncbi:protein arginine methyltransferase NDUFAF7, mitochondrial-like [Dendronephthya gigantea]|uniref:protein arginine methyltransferase NDUFAF7, mitochondrial-like n=1 Tax=Dendronephthya gigantea TaxID=151771 RepID=UPI001068D88C|nr:protein arginine methyltransferase NDUFAF7, mitochondrial-like [Dendronephthya gigantea]